LNECFSLQPAIAVPDDQPDHCEWSVFVRDPEISEIKELRSTSRESISTIAIELRDEVVDAEKIWSKIRDRLGDAETQMPVGALQPRFERMNFKAFAALTALRWQQKSGDVNYAVLKRWGQELEDRIQTVVGTEEVEIFGQPTEEILVTLDSEQLGALGLSVAEVSRQITAADPKVAAGQLRGIGEDLLIEIAGELDSVQRIENIPIRPSRMNCQRASLWIVCLLKTITSLAA